MTAKRVNKSNVPPNNLVGYLAMQWSTGSMVYGCGALIDSRHILTCSHNMVDAETASPPLGWSLQTMFYPGCNEHESKKPLTDGLAIEAGFYSNNFLNGQDTWDVGLYRLAEPLKEPLSTYFSPTVTGVDIVDQDVTLLGYPADREGEMWVDVDKVVSIHVPTNTMRFDQDTWSGNSGAPAWTYNAAEDVLELRAIHISRHEHEVRRGLLVSSNVKAWVKTALTEPTPSGPGFHLVGL